MAVEVSQWVLEHGALASSRVAEGEKQMSSKTCEEGMGRKVLVKCLPGEHEDLRYNPYHPCKNQVGKCLQPWH